VFEIIAGFSAFGVAGFLRLDPFEDQLGTFTLGFLTYPTALAEIPGAPMYATLILIFSWAACFFITLFLLGIDSVCILCLIFN
jgi:solute carrier family 6 GABA transporter-like protein 1